MPSTNPPRAICGTAGRHATGVEDLVDSLVTEYADRVRRKLASGPSR
jgi:hypothetical protein